MSQAPVAADPVDLPANLPAAEATPVDAALAERGKSPFRHAAHVHVGVLALSLAVILLAAFLQVQNRTRVYVPGLSRTLPELCYWRNMFGVNCPGCGLTRCFIAMAHFDPAAAWRYNPVGMLLFGAVLFQVPFRVLQWRRVRQGRLEIDWPFLPYLLVGLCALLIVQWFVRLMW